MNPKKKQIDNDLRVEQPHKSDLRKRMNRVLGQVQGVANMIEDDRYCVDILVQISAARSALHQVSMQLMGDHIKGCVHKAIQEGHGDEAITELMGIMGKLNK